MSALHPPLKLDDKGRCCGRKPLVYRTRQDARTLKGPHKYCVRCNAAFDMDTGQQIENWAYREVEGGFVDRIITDNLRKARATLPNLHPIACSSRASRAKHTWIAAYLPMVMSKMAALMRSLRCPRCAGKSLFVASKEEALSICQEAP